MSGKGWLLVVVRYGMYGRVTRSPPLFVVLANDENQLSINQSINQWPLTHSLTVTHSLTHSLTVTHSGDPACTLHRLPAANDESHLQRSACMLSSACSRFDIGIHSISGSRCVRYVRVDQRCDAKMSMVARRVDIEHAHSDCLVNSRKVRSQCHSTSEQTAQKTEFSISCHSPLATRHSPLLSNHSRNRIRDRV